MQIRHKETGELANSQEFNTHGLGEIIVCWADGEGMDSDYIKDYDVQLASGVWRDLRQAFKEKDLIIDNYNTRFFEPETAEDRQRGYTLH